jgi:hypothetical protein
MAEPGAQPGAPPPQPGPNEERELIPTLNLYVRAKLSRSEVIKDQHAMDRMRGLMYTSNAS